jgi:hypothetical protein
MIATRLAAFFAPFLYLFGLVFGLCWLFHICGPLMFLWNLYMNLSQALLRE